MTRKRKLGAGQRIYEVWIARQRRGKTTALRARVRDVVRNQREVRSVWVLDQRGEWPGILARELHEDDILVVGSTSEYLSRSRDHGLPRLVVWRLGEKAASYFPVIKESIAEGEILLVIDEAYEFAPQAGPAWTGDENLRRIVFSGRHLPDCRGELHRTHLIVATQYPRTLNPRVWGEAETVIVGTVEGEAMRSWIRENFGEAELEAVEALKPYQWRAVRTPDDSGRLPPLPGYGRNG